MSCVAIFFERSVFGDVAVLESHEETSLTIWDDGT